MPKDPTYPPDTDNDAWRALLRQAKEASHLTWPDFARCVLARHPRSVQRWAAGEIRVPGVIRDWIRGVSYIRTRGLHVVITIVKPTRES